MKNNELKLSISKLYDSLDILTISDLHLSKNSKSNNVDILMRTLINSKEKFDYICIVGDLVNDSSYLDDYDFSCSIVYFISILEKLLNPQGKIIFSIGNHDIMYFDGKWKYDKKESVKKFISYYTDTIVLDNQSMEDTNRNLIFFGLTNSFDLYEYYKENSEVFFEELNNLISQDKHKDTCAKFLLAHLARPILEMTQSTFDITIGGHYHNGCMPNFLVNAPGTRGIFHPQDPMLKPSFPKNVRGTFECNGKYVILNGAINPFNEIQPLNNLYGSYSTTLRLNK